MTLKGVDWAGVLGGSAFGAGILAGCVAFAADGPPLEYVRLALVALVVAAAFVLDEPAAAAVDAVPASRRRPPLPGRGRLGASTALWGYSQSRRQPSSSRAPATPTNAKASPASRKPVESARTFADTCRHATHWPLWLGRLPTPAGMRPLGRCGWDVCRHLPAYEPLSPRVLALIEVDFGGGGLWLPGWLGLLGWVQGDVGPSLPGDLAC